MTQCKAALLLALATSLSACEPRGGGDNASSNATQENGTSAATLCLFDQQDTKDWAASPDAAQDVVVRGKVHVSDAKYTARLDRPEKNGATARLWLSMAEIGGGTPPSDGWHDITFTIEDDGALQSVEIWCDMETRLAAFPVRRN